MKPKLFNQWTQPKLYQLIAKHPNPREIYKNQLLEDFGEEIISKLKEKFQFEKIRLKISKQKILPETDFVGVILER